MLKQAAESKDKSWIEKELDTINKLIARYEVLKKFLSDPLAGMKEKWQEVLNDYRKKQGLPFEEIKPQKQPAPKSHAETTQRVKFEQLDKERGFPKGTMASLMWQESRGDPNAISKVGALGRFQVMPGTAKSPGFGLKSWDPKDTKNDNDAKNAADYLAALMRKHKSLPLALAAYNAGSGNVDKHNGIPPFKETQDYVQKIMEDIEKTKLGQSPHNLVTFNQENNFNITGTNPQVIGDNVARAQSRVNSDNIRDFKTKLQ